MRLLSMRSKAWWQEVVWLQAFGSWWVMAECISFNHPDSTVIDVGWSIGFHWRATNQFRGWYFFTNVSTLSKVYIDDSKMDNSASTSDDGQGLEFYVLITHTYKAKHGLRNNISIVTQDHYHGICRSTPFVYGQKDKWQKKGNWWLQGDKISNHTNSSWS